MRTAWGAVPFALVVVADQATKWLILRHFDLPGDGVALTGFFNIVLVWNRGVSFGMLGGAGGPWLPVALAGVIAACLVVWLSRERKPVSRLAIWLVLAGALGNVIDRLRFGAVVDFLDFHLAGYHWPAFNVADSAITLGALLLVADSLLLSRAGLREPVRKV